MLYVTFLANGLLALITVRILQSYSISTRDEGRRALVVSCCFGRKQLLMAYAVLYQFAIFHSMPFIGGDRGLCLRLTSVHTVLR